MKTVYASLGFALGASAALLPRDQCCFSLTASGSDGGVVGQLGDGQNRIGQTGGLATQSATYCLNNGGLTDQNGRGCILTPPTTQFQCDTGATPTTGFSVNSNGDLAYNGNTQFYACDTGDHGGSNIYTTTSSAQTGCEKITLNTGGKCAGNGGNGGNGGGASGSASQPAASKPASSAPAASKPASSAPAPSAPATSKPVSSAPAPPAPAASKPASSAPAPSAPAPAPSAPAPAPSAPASQPAGSAPPAGPSTVTIMQTHYETVTSCPASVNCPATQPGGNQGSAPPAPMNSGPAGSAPAPPAPMNSGPASSAPAPPAPKPSGTSTGGNGGNGGNGNGNGNACPTSLSGAYQTPHAILPINKNSPSTSYGTQYNATISSSKSTIFNFDIPQSYSGKQCSIIFLFPEQKDLETSSFTASGSGGLKFDMLSSAASMDVSYNSFPKPAKTLDQIDGVKPGNSYVVSTGPCAAGMTESIEVSSVGGYALEFFEDWNPSPIGLFVTSC